MKTSYTNDLAKKAIATASMASMLIAFAACNNEKLYSNPEMTASQTQTEAAATDELTYESVTTRTKAFDEELSLYMKDHRSEATITETEGTSYAGTPVYAVYTVSEDGKYRALQMEKTIENGIVMDEYFDMGDAMLFARSTIYEDGSYEPVEKYYITGGTVYKLDSETQSLVTVAVVGSDTSAQAQTDLDMYFSFEEIVAIYG